MIKFEEYYQRLKDACMLDDEEAVFRALPYYICIWNKVAMYDGIDKSHKFTEKYSVKYLRQFDWSFEVGYDLKSNLNNRDEFDEIIRPKHVRDQEPSFIHDKISIRKAFEIFHAFISIKDELNESREEELFNKDMINVFGENDGDEINPLTNIKTCMVENFRVLHDDDNFMIGTAERADKYLFFCWCY